MTSFFRGGVSQWGSSSARCEPTSVDIALSVFANSRLAGRKTRMETHSRNSAVQGPFFSVAEYGRFHVLERTRQETCASSSKRDVLFFYSTCFPKQLGFLC